MKTISTFKHILSIVVLAFASVTTAFATTTLTNGGLTVYDSASDATWTQNANLLGTLESRDSNIINTIINDSNGVINTPNVLNPSGVYTLTTGDFGVNGVADWWAAQGFVNYLNVTNYANLNNWSLPTQDATCNGGYGCAPGQLANVFFGAVGGYNGIYSTTNPFSNVQGYVYWSGTEWASSPVASEIMVTNQFASEGYTLKNSQQYIWAVSNSAPVPLPGTIWMFLIGTFSMLWISDHRLKIIKK